MEIFEEKEKEKEKGPVILNNEDIIFKHEDIMNGIESVFCFKDGDILIFKNKYSLIFDGKTFNKKMQLDFLGARCAFCYLSEKEFILIKDVYFSLYEFTNGRNSCKEISKVEKNSLTENDEKNKNIFPLSNNDLINISLIGLTPIVKQYRRVEDNNKIQRYEIIDNLELNDIEDVINLENDEFLTIKKFQNTDEILFKVYSNKDYTILRFNRIDCTINGKRRIFFSTLPFFKVKKNKLFMAGIYYLNIFDIDTLELETTIKINPEIRDVAVLNNNCVLMIECNRNLVFLKEETNYCLTKVLIDFDTNDIIKRESNDITDDMGEFKTLFNIYNYNDKGLVTITDQYILKIYKKINS